MLFKIVEPFELLRLNGLFGLVGPFETVGLVGSFGPNEPFEPVASFHEIQSTLAITDTLGTGFWCP